MSKMTRRQVLKYTAAGGATAAIGFPAVLRAAKPYDGKVLSVFSYAGSFEDTVRTHLVPVFEKETGARIRLDVGWWDMLPKLKASPPGQPVYDVVITDPTQGFPSIREGLFQKFDSANIPNAKLTHDGMQANWVQSENWGVNLAGSLMTMAFNSETVSDYPSHWHDLLNDRWRGKLALYDALYMSLFTYAQMKAGVEGRPGQGRAELQKDLDGVLQFAAEHRDINRVFWGATGDFLAKIFQKEVEGGVGHGSDLFRAEGEGKPLKTVLPSEGTAAVHMFWTITEGTKEKRLAEEWINRFFATDFQTKWGSYGYEPVSQLEAAPLAAKENSTYDKFQPKTKEEWDAVSFYPYEVYFEGDNWAHINDFWDRKVLRKG